jgi:polysaccharide export outer membrane protein
MLMALSLGACSLLPNTGPMASEVAGQAQSGDEVLFDVVQVDERVVHTLLGQPKESFKARFAKRAQPPELKIAIGDTVSVAIWESALGGLFSETPPETSFPGARPGTEPLAPESRPAPSESSPLRDQLFGPIPPTGQPSEGNRPSPRRPPSANTPSPEALSGAAPQGGRQSATIPDQQVGADGAISVPFAGRIPAAGRSPAEVQQTIEARLAQKALEPQALVIIKKSTANAVTVAGEMVPGARVPLSGAGDRLLEVIAAAGGAQAPVHETFVRLSRDGITATIPLQRLVSDPTEDIYAQPGDVLTLVQIPQTFSVFGATGRNDAIKFDAEDITLSEAVAKSQGLRDDLANPKGVFLFRYEPVSIVRALDQPIASRPLDGSSPIVYRFDFSDANSYLFAKEFPVRDKDIVFIADAAAAQLQKLFTLIATVTGPIVTGIVTCRTATC